MLIHLQSGPEALGKVPRAILMRGIRELARSHRRGHHLVVVDRSTAAWLLKNVPLYDDEKATLIRIQQGYTQAAGLIRRAIKYIQIKCPSEPSIHNPRVIDVDFEDLLGTDILNRTALVTEDLHGDGRLFREILGHLSRLCNIPPFQCDALHGGGGRADKILEEMLHDRRIVCVAIDSDKRFPQSAASRVQTKMEGIISKYSWKFAFLMATPRLELENIVPLQLVAEIEKYSHPSITVLNRIAENEEAKNCPPSERHWLYFDVKEGMSPHKFRKIMDPSHRSWIQFKMAYAGLNPEVDALPGFGEHLIKRVLDDDRAMKRLRHCVRSSAWLCNFGVFFGTLAWITAGGRRQFT